MRVKNCLRQVMGQSIVLVFLWYVDTRNRILSSSEYNFMNQSRCGSLDVVFHTNIGNITWNFHLVRSTQVIFCQDEGNTGLLGSWFTRCCNSGFTAARTGREKRYFLTITVILILWIKFMNDVLIHPLNWVFSVFGLISLYKSLKYWSSFYNKNSFQLSTGVNMEINTFKKFNTLILIIITSVAHLHIYWYYWQIEQIKDTISKRKNSNDSGWMFQDGFPMPIYRPDFLLPKNSRREDNEEGGQRLVRAVQFFLIATSILHIATNGLYRTQWKCSHNAIATTLPTPI